MDKLLPYETFSEILSYLKKDQASLLQISLTCKKFHEITIPLLYKSPQFTTFSSFQSFTNTLSEANALYVRDIDLHMVPHRWDSLKINHCLYTLTDKAHDLEQLNLGLCSQLTNKVLKRIIRPLHDLRVLSLDQCTLIGDEAIETLVVQCPYIQELYLGSTHITDKALHWIATKLILLTHLYLPGCENITEAGISTLTTQCKTLQHFDIKDCYNVVGDFGIEQLRMGLDETPVLSNPVEEDEWEDMDSEDED
ncbi:hypothetical protein INT47_000015 [Mucor saturninus]|uniref:F-box domain-containing protein n=1 Tax=Mucor saturninus TaxID=64648 RepID=A0A8H7V5G7_9FUNG|nr:hypothetical protein INT47_000015 [Mucor saturninus]